MSIDFRWVGPGILKEVSDDIVTVHKPGALVKDHSLPDARVKLFLSQGVAELFKVAADGQIVSLTPEGNAQLEATPVQSMSDGEQARLEEEFQRNHDDAKAMQALATPVVAAPSASPVAQAPAPEPAATVAGPVADAPAGPVPAAKKGFLGLGGGQV